MNILSDKQLSTLAIFRSNVLADFSAADIDINVKCYTDSKYLPLSGRDITLQVVVVTLSDREEKYKFSLESQALLFAMRAQKIIANNPENFGKKLQAFVKKNLD